MLLLVNCKLGYVILWWVVKELSYQLSGFVRVTSHLCLRHWGQAIGKYDKWMGVINVHKVNVVFVKTKVDFSLKKKIINNTRVLWTGWSRDLQFKMESDLIYWFFYILTKLLFGICISIITTLQSGHSRANSQCLYQCWLMIVEWTIADSIRILFPNSSPPNIQIPYLHVPQLLILTTLLI